MAVDDEARQDVLDALGDAHEWLATASRWKEIDDLVVRILAAFEDADADALTSATAELEIISPRRATDANQGEKTKAPDPVLDRINDTVHKVGK